MFPHSSFPTAGANPGPRTVSLDLPGLFKHPLNTFFPFPESPRNWNAIPYADLDCCRNKHIPLTLSGWFELPDLAIALQRHGFGILFPHGPLLAGTKPSRRARMESDHSPWRVV